MRGAAGCVAVADSTNDESLASALKWKKLVEENSDLINNRSLPVFLVQNKCDLPTQHMMSDDELQQLAVKYEFLSGMKISAKTGHNVEECFQKLVGEMVKRHSEATAGDSIIGDNRRNRETLTLKSSVHSIVGDELHRQKRNKKCAC